MRKTNLLLLSTFLVTSLPWLTQAQTLNYRYGLAALNNQQYAEAIENFTYVLEHEKFEIGGDELTDVYGYLAQSSTVLLVEKLNPKEMSSIEQNQSLLQMALKQTIRTRHYPKSRSLVRKSEKTLVSLVTTMTHAIADSLLTTNKNYPCSRAINLSNLAIEILDQYSADRILEEKWVLFDVLSLSHYYLGNKEEALIHFLKARLEFNRLETLQFSMLHLSNYELIGSYLFDERQHLKKSKEVYTEASSYVKRLIANSAGSILTADIAELNRLDREFSKRLSRINAELDKKLLADI
ncbi:MAG: hypothetical protein ABJF11_16175 [Reichenbachiella sp.]|uniref:hypothetical protein n=1 Tax=Reichenbachiella sp. TaxID=2184521 RepID=UPI003266AFAF